jgi:succinoglycan biosynthesis protein ExoM
MPTRIAICIATYRRPTLLAALLDSLDALVVPPDMSIDVRVIDNDSKRTAEPVVQDLTARGLLAGRLRYAVEPRNSISLARNRAIEMGRADLVMFIDDDEVADPRCLIELLSAMERTETDAAFGYVGGVLPSTAPAWMRRGGFFDHPTGRPDKPLYWRGTRAGCTLVVGELFYDVGMRFDPAFGRSGAEYVDLFAPEAIAWERVPPERANLRFLLRRHYRNGLNYHRLRRRGAHSRHPAIQLGGRLARSTVHAIVGIPALLLGRPEWMVRGAMGVALAAGGLVAWHRPAVARSVVGYGAGARR